MTKRQLDELFACLKPDNLELDDLDYSYEQWLRDQEQQEQEQSDKEKETNHGNRRG